MEAAVLMGIDSRSSHNALLSVIPEVLHSPIFQRKQINNHTITKQATYTLTDSHYPLKN